MSAPLSPTQALAIIANRAPLTDEVREAIGVIEKAVARRDYLERAITEEVERGDTWRDKFDAAEQRCKELTTALSRARQP